MSIVLPSFGNKPMNQLEHNSDIDVYQDPSYPRANRIICTIGPKTQSVEALKGLIGAGMNIARMNFSHGSHEYHLQTIHNVRQAAAEMDAHIAIALDTKGPEIRTGLFTDPEGAVITAGDIFKLSTNPKFKECGTKDLFYVDYENITTVMNPGDRVFIDDGVLNLEVQDIPDEETLVVKAMNSHVVTNRKGCNLPNVDVDLPAVSTKDKEDLAFGAEHGVDFVFASFIRSAEQVMAVRNALGDKGEKVRIISKIENYQGVREIGSIIKAADGIMVARGDLGVEIPAEKVVLAQKKIIAMCNIRGKPVICATQMLESMTSNPRPTRAEVSDVANAVLDGADAVMLSGETAKGLYPTEVVEYMAKICLEAQEVQRNETVFNSVKNAQLPPVPVEETVCSAAVFSSFEIRSSALIVLSNTGRSAFFLAKYRPLCPIICVSQSKQVCRQLGLYRGVFAVYYDTQACGEDPDRDRRVALGIRYGMQKLEILAPGDNIIAVHADKTTKGFANQQRIVPVPRTVPEVPVAGQD